jgi:hypothetical protein
MDAIARSRRERGMAACPARGKRDRTRRSDRGQRQIVEVTTGRTSPQGMPVHPSPSSGANDRRPTHDPWASSPSAPAPILERSEARSNVRVPRCMSACSAARCTRPVSTRSSPKAAGTSSRWVRGAEGEEPGQPGRDWLRSRPTAPGKQPQRRTLGLSSPLRSPPPDASPAQLNTPNNHNTTSKLSGTPRSHSRNPLPMISPPGRSHRRSAPFSSRWSSLLYSQECGVTPHQDPRTQLLYQLSRARPRSRHASPH